MSKHAQSDAAALPSNRLRSTTINSTGSNRASARVIGDIVDVSTNNWIRLVRENKLLVDKTDLLLDVMKYGSPDVILRPRRFGKTMFLNMAYDFLNVARTDEKLDETKRIFKEMNIHKVDPTFVDEHCGRAIENWRHAISDTSKAELNDSRDRLNRMKNNIYNSVDDSIALLRELVDYLSEYYNAKCIVLVD
ncbi:hypothetical protein EV182_007326, partial [Spiromyces aspiralis]